MSRGRYVTVNVDYETHSLLKELAGGWGVAPFLRHLAHTLKANADASKVAEKDSADDEDTYVKRWELDERLRGIEHALGLQLYNFPPTREIAHKVAYKRVPKRKPAK